MKIILKPVYYVGNVLHIILPANTQNDIQKTFKHNYLF